MTKHHPDAGSEMEAARRAPVYLQAAEIDDPPPPFRTGEAGLVWVGGAGTLETDARVPLSANAVATLFGHGVIDELNRLALEGRLGSGRDAILPQGILEKAAAIHLRGGPQDLWGDVGVRRDARH